MKSLLLSSVLVFIFTCSIIGQQNLPQNIVRTAFAFEQVTVAAASIPLTAATYNPTPATNTPNLNTRAELATISCETAQIRYRDDGVAPTAAVGSLMNIGDYITIYGFQNIVNFAMIRTGGVSALCSIHYYRSASNAN
jgi:hypothetical protein